MNKILSNLYFVSLVAAVSIVQSTSPNLDPLAITQVKSLVKDEPEVNWRFSISVSAVTVLSLSASAGSNVITTAFPFTDFNFIVIAFYNSEDVLKTNLRAILYNNFKTWFFFDLISAVPVYTLTKIFEPICNGTYITSFYNVDLDHFHYLFIEIKYL